MGTSDQVLLSAKEAAKFLNVAQATVYRLIHKGLLTKVKEPGKRAWKITMESLEAYETAETFTLAELCTRLIKLERKVDFLLTQSNSAGASSKAAKEVGLDFTEMQRQMKKRHPDLFS